MKVKKVLSMVLLTCLMLVSCKTVYVNVYPEIQPVEFPDRPILSQVSLDSTIPKQLVDNYLSLVEYTLSLEANVNSHNQYLLEIGE